MRQGSRKAFHKGTDSYSSYCWIPALCSGAIFVAELLKGELLKCLLSDFSFTESSGHDVYSDDPHCRVESPSANFGHLWHSNPNPCWNWTSEGMRKPFFLSFPLLIAWSWRRPQVSHLVVNSAYRSVFSSLPLVAVLLAIEWFDSVWEVEIHFTGTSNCTWKRFIILCFFNQWNMQKGFIIGTVAANQQRSEGKSYLT